MTKPHVHCWAGADPHRCSLCCICDAKFTPESAKNPNAVALGKLKSPRKAEASRQNGKKGGRPKKEKAQ